MRYICIILGFLPGKTKVRCDECANLDPEGLIAASLAELKEGSGRIRSWQKQVWVK